MTKAWRQGAMRFTIVDPEAITWTCHACYQERPDAAISVWSFDIGRQWGLKQGQAMINLRYCNDNQECFSVVEAKAPLTFKRKNEDNDPSI